VTTDHPSFFYFPFPRIHVVTEALEIVAPVDEHQIEPLLHMPAGQSIGYFNEVQTVAEIMANLMRGTQASMQQLQSLNS
jgi:hypothetical protein